MLITSLFKTIFVANATYNSLNGQVAYCKMIGFDTVSRSTSEGPSLYTSSDIWIGVGISDNQFNGSICGMCINIHEIINMRNGNNELTMFDNSTISIPFKAMVFDQCHDQICLKDGFLDFDVHSMVPPTWQGNPYHVKWTAIDCPVYNEDTQSLKHRLEYLICNKHSCKIQDVQNWYGKTLLNIWDPYFFSIIVRNSRIPIVAVNLDGKPLHYRKGLGWTYDGYYNITTKNFVLELIGYDYSSIIDVFEFNDVLNLLCYPSYRGGVILKSTQQI